jgi:hypothetical protein
MGTFSKTAIFDYCLLSANQGKTNFHFPFLFAANKKFAISVFYLQQAIGSCHFL